VRAQLTQRMAQQQQQRTALKQAAQQEQAALSIDGRRIYLLANIGSEAEAEAARQWGAEGVGLLRTEFLFATATTLPGEVEQRNIYAQVFRAFKGTDSASTRKPVVVRTLDAGADKPMPALNSVIGMSTEANPQLGLRGIRISLAHQALLEDQVRALLLAAAETEIALHIMFPMITTVDELIMARGVVDRVYEQLKQRQFTLPSYLARVPVGIMVEVPAAVVMAPELAEIADFFSIGSNDLLQYTVACDRTNAAVTHLYNPMQPAVLRLIAQVAEAGRRAGKPVAVCGEMAGNPRLAPVLVGLGVDELSMTPTALPKIRAALDRRSAQELSDLAQKVLHVKTVTEVEQICNEF
jgi:phosphoenolpyruvate-protein kinase (PTS system EI component)